MTGLKTFSFSRWVTSLRHAFGFGVLNGPIARTPDKDIDRALTELGRTRADLFTLARAGAAHRVRMARMMAAYRIDPRRAVEKHWNDLKIADTYCYYCPHSGRCDRWLEQPWHELAPQVFCRNEKLFSAIAAEQRE